MKGFVAGVIFTLVAEGVVAAAILVNRFTEITDKD